MAKVRASQLKHDKEIAEKQRADKTASDKVQQWHNQCDAFNTLIQQSPDLSDQL